MSRKPDPVPHFSTEAEERTYWEHHDSADHIDWRKAAKVRLPNLKPSSTSISLRLPNSLLEQIKVAAAKRDVPYLSLIKIWPARRSIHPERSDDLVATGEFLHQGVVRPFTYKGRSMPVDLPGYYPEHGNKGPHVGQEMADGALQALRSEVAEKPLRPRF
ncbi:BrnA antitoxin family protein (plasmid) [Rhizobium sp. T1470]|uniref:BrnA antitoxin family protein n=1 Tax=Rhizobium sp. T1473 TaxID=555321 RepID=UPI001CD80195|nr:BrnA antitoxin family protein [Rhizobium sp. T1473]MCA0804759.1 BrnA antitoxin family protein [Rhizobium sp. T1473]